MYLFRRRLKHERLSPAGQLLVNDVEAYLSGTYEEYVRHRGCDIPGWSRLNLLAHGDLARIRALEHPEPSNDPCVKDRHNGAWSDVQELLARQLLTLVGNDPSVLLRIQQTTLIPLELRLIKQSGNEELGALAVVKAAQSVLRSVS